jgi:hypothetical protein
MKTLLCQYCTQEFLAKRSDAVRCKNCHSARKAEWQASPRGREMRRDNHRKLRQEALAGYGGRCECCKEDTFEFLALDHVNGGGRKEREIMSTGQIARKVINEGFPSTYRVLCHNCNQAKGWYGLCPHQWKRTA